MPAKCIYVGLLLFVVTGCARPQLGDVSGRVTIGGNPMKLGSVVFFSSDGTYVAGVVGRDGQYRAVGIPSGPVRIAVYSPDPAPMQLQIDKPAEADARRKAAGWVPIPVKYNDPGRSGLKLEVIAPEGTFDIDIAQ